MVTFWIVVAIMAPVLVFGVVAALLIIGFDPKGAAVPEPEQERHKHWISIT